MTESLDPRPDSTTSSTPPGDSAPGRIDPSIGNGSSADHDDADAKSAASSFFDSIRETVDDLTERATPAVRGFSAKAAELTASAADKAAPMARKAGEATAEASNKLAERSRHWASDVRAAMSEAADKTADAARDAGAATATAVKDATGSVQRAVDDATNGGGPKPAG